MPSLANEFFNFDTEFLSHSMPEGVYLGNGGYVLDTIEIIVDEGKITERIIDLSESFVDVSLFESIYEGGMSGTISVADSTNMKDTVPLFGGEKVHLRFYTLGAEQNPIEFYGVLYDITSDSRLSEHAAGFSIKFMSEFMYYSERRFMQKSYESSSTDVVKDIFAGAKMTSDKPLSAFDSTGIRRYAFGAVRPLEAISTASRGAISNDGKTGYLFFEDNQSYQFVPLETLYTQEPVNEYHYQLPGFYEDVTQRNVEKFSAIQKVEVIEDNNALERIREGQHGSTWVYRDLRTKEVAVFVYTKDGFYRKESSLGAIPTKKDIDNPDNSDNVFYRVVPDVRNIVLDKAHIAEMVRKQAFTIRVVITVFGDSAMTCGTVVNATVPDWQSDQKENSRMIRGRFLIANIKHVLTNKSEYRQVIELVKDSWEEMTP